MKYIFIYFYIVLCLVMFYPSTFLIWVCEPAEMRRKGYFDIQDFFKQLKSELL